MDHCDSGGCFYLQENMKKKMKQKPRNQDKYSDGSDLELGPSKSLDINRTSSALKMVLEMRDTAFGGRELGKAHEVLYEMFNDSDCFVTGTFSGAMTVAKMGLMISEMIDRGMLNAVVTTGAVLVHGIIETIGLSHFKCNPRNNDSENFYKGYNRIYDTIELENNLDQVEEIVKTVLNQWDCSKSLSGKTFCEEMGRYLVKNSKGRGILKSAFHKNIPVYVPVLTDSELGLDINLFRKTQMLNGETPLVFNVFDDVDDYADRIINSKTMGIFTIGGGVPRNWAQQVAPYLDIMNRKLDKKITPKRFKYAVRICPEPVQWGGLSGCTYSECVSWGKMVPEEQGGMWAEVMADATIAWPLLLRSVIERLGLEKKS
ncbi:MAG: deoxyhypusine synthase family protein [Candidatus Aminicenantaceae bacterium]